MEIEMKNSRPKHVLKQGYLAMSVCTAGIPFDKENPDPPPMVCHPDAEPRGVRSVYDGFRSFDCPHCLMDFSTTDRIETDALQQRARVP